TFRRRAATKSRGFAACSARRLIVGVSTFAFAAATSSALTARILRRISATRELLCKFHERIQLGPRRAALDQIERLLHAVLEAGRLAPHVDRRAGIERDDVSRGAGGVLESGYDYFSRLLHGRDAKRPRVVHRQAESLGMDEVLADLPVLELPDHRLTAHR